MVTTEGQAPPETPAQAPMPAVVPHRAGDLAQPAAAMTPANTNREVIEYFHDHPGEACLAVVEDGAPIGLINRNIFLTGFSLPYRREVYERKSCIAFMDKDPLVVDAELPLGDLGRLAVDAGSKVLHDGFIVVQRGRFAGLGSGIDLLRALGQLEADRNRVIRESIDYARIIQGAVLRSSRGELEQAGLADQHLLWQPRDAVGGDAFFARRIRRDGREGLFLALLDCTGHGVPGAFTAMLMTSFLGHALDLAAPWEPGRVLAEVNRRVKETLGQQHRGRAINSFEPEDGQPLADEGMDATCLWIDRAGGLTFAGAHHSLWIFPDGAAEPEEIKGDRLGVGYQATPDQQVWNNHPLACEPGTVVLATTDGITDQIGGTRRIAFGRRRLWSALGFADGPRPLARRLEDAYRAMAHHQGAEYRRDDVSLLAVKV
jgi:serine phosphatase RsbU (regulator of sigma subunit)